MALPQRALGADEHVVLHLRTHGKALVVPAVVGLACCLGIIAWFALSGQPAGSWGTYAVVGGAVLVLLWFSVLPFLRWRTSTYTVTNRRLITRQGILTRSGHDVPLNRINNVEYEQGVLDRALGCGTLVFETAASEPVTLHDIPDIERAHVTITDILFGVRPTDPGAAGPPRD